MNDSYSTVGVVKAGKMRVKDRYAFEKALAQFPDGLVSVTVETTTEKAQRSAQANRFQWKLFELIAAETGHSKDEIHDWMAEQFLTYQLETVDKQTGEVTSVRVTKGTSRLNTAEHAYFLDCVIKWAGEFLGMELSGMERSA